MSWPILLGGPTQWTVGLVATLISISSIIAADTYAFIGGKVFRQMSFLLRLHTPFSIVIFVEVMTW